MGGACSKYGRDKNGNKILIRKHEGKTELRRPNLRWENNVKIDLKGMVYEDVDLIQLPHNIVQWYALVNLRVP